MKNLKKKIGMVVIALFLTSFCVNPGYNGSQLISNNTVYSATSYANVTTDNSGILSSINTIKVTSVALNKTTNTLIVGNTDTLKATLAPSNATNKAVTWTSSNTKVATVNNGVIKAVSAGTTRITVTTADGSKTAKCIVTVNNPVVKVTSVGISKTTDILTVGGTDTLKATVAPSNATNKAVTWTSSNTKVATVNNGVIKAVSAGTATITVTTIDGSKTAKCAVTINNSTLMDKLIVLPNKDYNIIEAEKMINRLNKIPYPILKVLLAKNVQIILSTTNITGVPAYSYLKGVIPRGWEGTGKSWDDVPGAGGNPVVARIGYSEPGQEHGHGTINLELHETAHAIDFYVFNTISASESYKTMWKKEVKILFGDNPYFLNYSEEYFAETFAMYYLNEEQKQILKEKAPLTYRFIKNLENEIPKLVSVNANVI